MPPLTLAVALPSFPPWQLTFVEEVDRVSAQSKSLTVTVSTLVHPLASVTVTV